MRVEAIGTPFTYRWPGGEVRLEPGKPIELPPDRAAKLLARANGRVRQIELQDPTAIEPALRPDGIRPMIQAGDHVEWLSPALPRQQGEVLAVYGDHFEVYHPLAETLCRLPLSWITRVVNAPTNMEGKTQ